MKMVEISTHSLKESIKKDINKDIVDL
jgi:hypothetical protein